MHLTIHPSRSARDFEKKKHILASIKHSTGNRTDIPVEYFEIVIKVCLFFFILFPKIQFSIASEIKFSVKFH